jgi:hypothetical protein
MKNSILKSLILVFALTIASCSSDSLEEEIACIPTICYNGGISTPDCGCDCPEGFTGADCSIQKTPVKVLVTKIKVYSFLNNDTSGMAWDGLIGKPDIYVTIFDSKSTFYASNYYEDAISNNSNVYEFVPANPVALTNVSDFYGVKLYDYDNLGAGKDTEMGSVIFVPFLKPSTLPKSVILESPKLNLKIEVFLTYVY